MGIAIIIPGISFHNNMGKVNQTGGRELKSLSIMLEDSYTAPYIKLKARLNPLSSVSRSLIWSIEAGGQYAHIENDVLYIESGTVSQNITVKVASADDSTIYATKTISVTYDDEVIELPKVTVLNNATINTGLHLTRRTESVEITYKITGSRQNNAYLWGTENEHSGAYLSGSTSIVVDFGADNDREPYNTGSIINYRINNPLNVLSTDEFFIDHVIHNGELLTASVREPEIKEGFTDGGVLYILHPYSSYRFSSIEIYSFKIKDNGIVTADFVPAKKGNDYGFYNKVTKIFITNSGESGEITE